MRSLDASVTSRRTLSPKSQPMHALVVRHSERERLQCIKITYASPFCTDESRAIPHSPIDPGAEFAAHFIYRTISRMSFRIEPTVAHQVLHELLGIPVARDGKAREDVVDLLDLGVGELDVLRGDVGEDPLGRGGTWDRQHLGVSAAHCGVAHFPRVHPLPHPFPHVQRGW